MSRCVVAFFADTHGGHRLSLLNPTTKLLEQDEEGVPHTWTPALTSPQRWLWDCYQDDIADVWEFCGDDPLAAFHVGDPTWGAKYPEDLVDTSVYGQVMIAVANMSPWFDIPNLVAFRLEEGTNSHEFGQATASRFISQTLRKNFPSVDVGFAAHHLEEIDGCLFDIAHHGPGPGIRIWTNGNQARYYLRSAMLDEISFKQPVPSLFVRGHVHTPIHEVVQVPGDPTWESAIDILPPYCCMTPYARQVTRSVPRQWCGLVAWEIIDGKLGRHIAPKHMKELRTKENLTTIMNRR